MDKWIGDQPLMESFPRLYLNSEQQDGTLEKMGRWIDNKWHWELKWRRAWIGRESYQWETLQTLLQGQSLRHGQTDTWKWLYDTQGSYFVKSAYEAIQAITTIQSNNVSPFINVLWKLKIPPKVAIFCWKMQHNSLATMDNLRRRNIQVQDVNATCIFSEAIVLPQDLVQHFLQQPYQVNSNKERNRWQVIWCAVTWNIWKARNNSRFRGVQFLKEKTYQDIIYFSWLWLSMDSSFQYSYQQWIVNPGACL
uniref:Ribonuclease H protein At1g65750 family n=1 Tax=Cajanus cajan TaxID=3821 RepID=A0A151T5H0_CAJCA|nr:Putative ribonuclease H protein At1g65750 family [Cajanus cajan]